MFDALQQRRLAAHVQKGVVLTGEGGLCCVLSKGRGADSHRQQRSAAGQHAVDLDDRFLNPQRQVRPTDGLSNEACLLVVRKSGTSQQGFDLASQVVGSQVMAIGVGREAEARWHGKARLCQPSQGVSLAAHQGHRICIFIDFIQEKNNQVCNSSNSGAGVYSFSSGSGGM